MYLKNMIVKTLLPNMYTHMQYPTSISKTLGLETIDIGAGTATIEIETSIELHGNQQGTVHGGLITLYDERAKGR